MNDWGIALVGFVGAIVGAVVGFVGLAWQHSAARDEDVRKVGAQLLYHAEVVKNGYVQYRNTRRGDMAESTQPQRVSDSIDKVGELLRYIEIAARVEIYIKVVELVAETGKFQADMKDVGFGNSQIPENTLEDMIDQWFIARNILAMELRFPGARPLRWRLYQLKRVLLNSR
jgi:hypothetical protein